jgi:hypothetical protein
MEQARQVWQQQQEQCHSQQEDYRRQHRRLENLKLARLREGIRVQTEKVSLCQSQLEDLDKDADVQVLANQLQQVDARLRYIYLREESELQSQEQQILARKEQLERKKDEISRHYQLHQTEYQNLLIKKAQAQTQMELAETEMQEIARAILDNYQHDEVAQEKERWEQRAAWLEKDRQANETELQQMIQERTTLQERLPAERRHLQVAVRQEEKLKLQVDSLEEQQQALLRHLQEISPEFSTIDSLYLHQHRISEHLIHRVETLHNEKERALVRDSQTSALFALYEHTTYYSADPLVEGWIEEIREQFSYLEAGTLFVQNAAQQRHRPEADYFLTYPFWAITLICRASEADRLMNRLTKYQKEMTQPLFILTTEEARKLIDAIEQPEVKREDVKRQVFPVGWEANLSRGVLA